MTEFPNHTSGYQGMLNIAWDKQEWEVANELCDVLIEKFPYHIPFYQYKIWSLVHLTKFDDAHQHLLEYCQKFPENVDLALTFTDIGYPQRKHKENIRFVNALLEKFPSHQHIIVNRLIGVYFNNNEPDKIIPLMEKYHQKPPTLQEQMQKASLIRLEQGHGEFSDELERIYEENPHDFGVAYALAYQLMYFNLNSNPNPKRTPKYALSIFEKLYQRYPDNRTAVNALIDVYIRLGMHDKAKVMIKEKLVNYSDANTLKRKAWLSAQEGDLDLATSYYQQALKKEFYAELLHANKGKDLIYRSQRPIPKLTYDDIPMFTLEHNEILRLPYFLEYYRKLGITHFFFVDNNSNDGSFDFLLAQPDCYVFWTDTSFSEAGSGISWIHALLDSYALEGQWCIHADCDELLVYPHCETHSLPKIIEYLEHEQSQMMASYMLDMYPKDLQTQLNADYSKSLIEISPYFYNDYEHLYQIQCPYVHTVGGIFHKFDVPPWVYEKTSLFKYNKDFRFLCSTHHTTPAKVSKVSSAYLHFKMLGDFQAKAKAEVERKEHFGGGAMYHKYAQMYEKFINTGMDLSQLDKSVKYQNSQQLVELNLIRTSTQWEEFCQLDEN